MGQRPPRRRMARIPMWACLFDFPRKPSPPSFSFETITWVYATDLGINRVCFISSPSVVWFRMRSIYWAKRDLRVNDNRSLSRALLESDETAALYILDPRMVDDLRDNVWYLSLILNSVVHLKKEIKLNVLYGRVEDVFDEILSRRGFDAVYTATPLSWSEKILVDLAKEACRRHGVRFIEVIDNVLADPFVNRPLNSFSSFYKSWVKGVDVRQTPPIVSGDLDGRLMDYDTMEVHEILSKLGLEARNQPVLNAEWGRRRLHSFNFSDYGKLRDLPYVDGTSRLSHFIGLGVLSIREIYGHASKLSAEYVRQLAWREFYYALWVKYPWIREAELKPYMRGFEWGNDKHLIDCFVKGRTGYPIIDAGVRQLLSEGWVHNRVRLIMANFLVKDLDVDWRVGVDFFKKHLVDYDEVVNVGNWQWAASVGVDPLPVRMFNPIKQSERYDPLCSYVKKYIPELEGVECRAIHNPLAHRIKGYFEPIVDHYEASKAFLTKVRKRMADWRTGRGIR